MLRVRAWARPLDRAADRFSARPHRRQRGVIGGGLRLNSIRSMFGDHAGLAHAAGIDAIGRGGVAEKQRDQDQDQDQDQDDQDQADQDQHQDQDQDDDGDFGGDDA